MSEVGAHVVKVIVSVVLIFALACIGILPTLVLSAIGAPRWLAAGSMVLLPMIVVGGYLYARGSTVVGKYLYDLPPPYKYDDK